jgi:hypothetical protein
MDLRDKNLQKNEKLAEVIGGGKMEKNNSAGEKR